MRTGWTLGTATVNGLVRTDRMDWVETDGQGGRDRVDGLIDDRNLATIILAGA